MSKTKINFTDSIKRQDQKQQGVFDGRYRQRVVIDKKKQEDKYKSRGKIKVSSFLVLLENLINIMKI